MTGSHRLIRCPADELFDVLAACCAAESAAEETGLRGRLPTRSDRRMLTHAAAMDRGPSQRAQMVSSTRFGQAEWEVTCEQGAQGSIAHLEVRPTRGPAKWLPGPVRTVYLTVVGGRMLDTLADYAAANRPEPGTTDQDPRAS